MKARVKATGEIVEFTELMLLEEDRTTYRKTEDLEFLDLPKDEPDYWEKLRHQYAGIFFKSFLDGFDNTTSIEKLMDNSIRLSKIFINKLKEES